VTAVLQQDVVFTVHRHEGPRLRWAAKVELFGL
jgi:hypothetical protein